MPKYYSPNLVQIPACHGSSVCDYDSEGDKVEWVGGRGSMAAMLIKEAGGERRGGKYHGREIKERGSSTAKVKK